MLLEDHIFDIINQISGRFSQDEINIKVAATYAKVFTSSSFSTAFFRVINQLRDNLKIEVTHQSTFYSFTNKKTDKIVVTYEPEFLFGKCLIGGPPTPLNEIEDAKLKENEKKVVLSTQPSKKGRKNIKCCKDIGDNVSLPAAGDPAHQDKVLPGELAI
ncbi:hypothetical protein LX64_05198, partial [Chitinophaga skermanii]